MAAETYKAKTKESAEREVMRLRRQLEVEANNWIALSKLYIAERRKAVALAKLAANGPAFFNPLEAFAAQDIRNCILRENGMNHDGTFIN
jgi:hypothetical protein